MGLTIVKMMVAVNARQLTQMLNGLRPALFSENNCHRTYLTVY